MANTNTKKTYNNNGNVDNTEAEKVEKETIETIEEPIVSEVKEPDTKKKEVADETQSILNDIQNGLKDVTKNDIVMDTKTEIAKIRPDELITVRSMRRGGFNWRCPKSQIPYRWPSIGHPEQVPYEDLYQMYINKKEYLTKPYLLIEDERVIKAFKLLEVYKNVASVNRLEKAIDSVTEMQKICEQALRVSMRDVLVERLSQMRNNGTLTNADVIDKAQDILNCEIIKM